MNTSLEQSGNRCVISFEGAVTVEAAGQLREVLIHALGDNPEVEMNFEEATDADLSCLQLICSAHRTAVKQEKLLTVTPGDSVVLLDAATRGGFIRHTGCSLDIQKNCLWTGLQK